MERLMRKVAVLSVLLWTHVLVLSGIALLLAFEGGIVLPMVLEQIGYYIGMGLGAGQSGPDGYALFFHFLALFTSALALYAFQRGEPWVRGAAYGALLAGVFAAPLGLVAPAYLVHTLRRPGFEDAWHSAPALQPKAARHVALAWLGATSVLGVLAAVAFFGFVSGHGVVGLLAFLSAPFCHLAAVLWLQRRPPTRLRKKPREETAPLPRLPDIVRAGR